MVLEHHGAVRAGAVDLAVLQQHRAGGDLVSPAIRLSKVDLPQPEWPMIETNSPLSMVRLMSFSTSVTCAAAGEGFVDVVELEIGVSWRLSSVGRCAAGDEGADRRDQPVEREADDADIDERDDDVGQPRASSTRPR